MATVEEFTNEVLNVNEGSQLTINQIEPMTFKVDTRGLIAPLKLKVAVEFTLTLNTAVVAEIIKRQVIPLQRLQLIVNEDGVLTPRKSLTDSAEILVDDLEDYEGLPSKLLENPVFARNIKGNRIDWEDSDTEVIDN